MAGSHLLLTFCECLAGDRPRPRVDPALTVLLKGRPFLLHLIAHKSELTTLRELRDLLEERSVLKVKQQVPHHQPVLFAIFCFVILFNNLLQFSVGYSLSTEIAQHQKTKRHAFDVMHGDRLGADPAGLQDYSPHRNRSDHPSTQEVHRLQPDRVGMPTSSNPLARIYLRLKDGAMGRLRPSATLFRPATKTCITIDLCKNPSLAIALSKHFRQCRLTPRLMMRSNGYFFSLKLKPGWPNSIGPKEFHTRKLSVAPDCNAHRLV